MATRTETVVGQQRRDLLQQVCWAYGLLAAESPNRKGEVFPPGDNHCAFILNGDGLKIDINRPSVRVGTVSNLVILTVYNPQMTSRTVGTVFPKGKALMQIVVTTNGPDKTLAIHLDLGGASRANVTLVLGVLSMVTDAFRPMPTFDRGVSEPTLPGLEVSDPAVGSGEPTAGHGDDGP